MLKNILSQLKTIFFETSEDSQITSKVRQNRGVMMFAFVILDVAIITLVDPLPTEEEANLYEGVLLGVFSSSRTSALQINTADGIYTIHTGRGRNFLASLEPFTGKRVKARAYYQLNFFFLPKLHLVQIEVDGIKFIQDWESIRTASKNNPAEIYFIVLTLFVIAITSRSIVRILKRATNLNKTS